MKSTFTFLNNIWGVDLANTQLLSKFNKEIRFLLCVIDIFSKYAWVVPLKGKKGITIADAFQKSLDESGPKRNKTWVDKESEFYNKLFKSQLQNNNIEMYSTHNEGKSVVAEKFISSLKNKIYKYMTSISKNVYIDELGDIVKHHRTIKLKPIDVKSRTYINFSKNKNYQEPKFKAGN